MPHIPGHNPYSGFVSQGGFASPYGMPDTSKLLTPPQPTTAVTQIPKTKQPTLTQAPPTRMPEPKER